MGKANTKPAKKHAGRSARVNEEADSLLFHALGDPTRRAMLDMLSAGPMSVSALAEPLGITLTAVTQHMQILEEAELAKSEKLGRVRSCRVEPRGFDRLEKWVKDHRTEWERKLDKLSAMLEEEDSR
ncbi:MAG: winged helix-turn-helix transcriptional regulator [Acidobacteriota bacterium]|nr:winged helix-turn-helix transcriptional regulator [Acidobacteriota bacterium]